MIAADANASSRIGKPLALKFHIHILVRSRTYAGDTLEPVTPLESVHGSGKIDRLRHNAIGIDGKQEVLCAEVADAYSAALAAALAHHPEVAAGADPDTFKIQIHRCAVFGDHDLSRDTSGEVA